MRSLNAIVVAPHADDAEIGAGGLLLAYRGLGWNTAVMLVGASDYTSSNGTIKGSDRVHEQDNACFLTKADRLGPLPSDLLRENEYRDGYRHIVRLVESCLGKTSTLIIPLPSHNQDHVAVHDACLTALRPPGGMKVTCVMAYEQPWQVFGPPPPYNGRHYLPITEKELALKIDAVRTHKSQKVANGEGMYGVEGIRRLAKMRGAECGHDLAEMFYLIRETGRRFL